jgi:hypothetical protein
MDGLIMKFSECIYTEYLMQSDFFGIEEHFFRVVRLLLFSILQYTALFKLGVPKTESSRYSRAQVLLPTVHKLMQ